MVGLWGGDEERKACHKREVSGHEIAKHKGTVELAIGLFPRFCGTTQVLQRCVAVRMIKPAVLHRAFTRVKLAPAQSV